jgi:hypothetical protein
LECIIVSIQYDMKTVMEREKNWFCLMLELNQGKSNFEMELSIVFIERVKISRKSTWNMR